MRLTLNCVGAHAIGTSKAFGMVDDFVAVSKLRQTPIRSPTVRVHDRPRVNILGNDVQKCVLVPGFYRERCESPFFCFLHSTKDPNVFNSMAPVILAFAELAFVDFDHYTGTPDFLA